MDKMKMELVWHNCKTCPPEAPHDHMYLLWDGESSYLAEYLYDRWYVEGQTVYMSGVEHMYWWTDIFNEIERFFWNKGGSVNG